MRQRETARLNCPMRAVRRDMRQRGCADSPGRSRKPPHVAGGRISLRQIPTGFRFKAQGCGDVATLGKPETNLSDPERVAPINKEKSQPLPGPFRVDAEYRAVTRGSSVPSQPWALRRNPVGIPWTCAELI